MTSLSSFKVYTTKFDTVSLDQYHGKVILIINTASLCNFTPQLEGQQKLYEKYRERGFSILGFPCNQFANQDPGTNPEIEQFCKAHYGVEFPIFAKIDVNGPTTHPLFQYLKRAARGLFGSEEIKWNFTKLLINRNGDVIARFAPITKPEWIENAIVAALG